MVLSIIVFTNLPITTTRASGIQVRQQTAGVSHARRASALPRFFDGNLSGVISWGDDTASRANVNLRTATHIVSGNSHHLARLQNGTIVAWGSNTKGQITIPTVLRSTNENADDIISMDAGDNHNLVISVSHNLDTGEETYRLRAWGDNSKGQVTLPSRATNVNTMPILVAAGANHSLAYINETNPTTGESKSSVISWGNSSSATVPAALNPVDTDEHSLIKIAAQGDHNAALLSDGIVIEWYTNGRPVTYNPPDGAIYEHIAVGNNFLLLVDNSGIMTGYGDNTKGQLNIPSNVSCWGRVSAGAAHVVAIEKDKRCREILEELRGAYPGRLETIEADALTIDASRIGTTPRRIVANLPYNVGTELLLGWLSVISDFDVLVLMFQSEVAARLTAPPATKAYGRLSVLTQWLCDVEQLFHVNPRAFTPPPAVNSTVVRLTPRPQPLAPARRETLERVTAAAFGQRRKMLRQSLKSLGIDGEALCRAAGIDPTARAEVLSVQDFCTLARSVDER